MMTRSLLRLGLIGAGRWGRVYARSIAELGNEGFVLSMLARHRRETPDWCPSDCRFTHDWRSLVTAEDIDAVIVSTPPSLHAEMAIAAMTNGKPVLIEKPLAMAGADAEAVNLAAHATGMLAMVDHTYLFDHGFRRMVALLPQIGPIRTIETKAGQWGPFRRDTPVLWDWGSHDLSMLLTMLGANPIEIAGRWLDRRSLPEGEGALVQLEFGFPGGATARIRFGNLLTEKTREVKVSGSDGTLTYAPFSTTRLTLAHGISGAPRPIPTEGDLPLTQCLREFADAIRQRCSSHESLALGGRIVHILAECARQVA